MYQGSYCIVAPIVTATCEEMNISISKTIFSVGLVSIAACAIIPVGGSLAMLAELNGYIAANGYEQYTMEAMGSVQRPWHEPAGPDSLHHFCWFPFCP